MLLSRASNKSIKTCAKASDNIYVKSHTSASPELNGRDLEITFHPKIWKHFNTERTRRKLKQKKQQQQELRVGG